MTNLADASARPCPAVGSYSCGSASGLGVRVFTSPCAPPNWRAMLPQESSAATTAKVPAARDDFDDVDELVLHADNTARPASRARNMRTDRCTMSEILNKSDSHFKSNENGTYS